MDGLLFNCLAIDLIEYPDFIWISINAYSLTKQKAPQVNLRRFLLPFVKIWVSKLKKERLLHYIWLAMTKILVIQLTYACLKRN
ncbi:hypothetical protein [Mycoplasmopsis bovis]|uniref:hypothetical protein n=1 Tax=Mycoplasmopsis bovis TaxID=28903 RepID=UPI00287F97C7|nr:hypothetical protein [Mycoplasmopsis bovis]WNA90927.1 hypothetical protein HYE45_04080 [Mycoplasmopsis bovis]